jgi:protein TonB
VRVGVAMSSTTEGGTVAAPKGNTLHGELPREGDGADAAPYRSESYLPPTRLRRLPRPIDCDPKRFDYPEAAKRAGIEGRVLLRIVVDERGRVADASVLEEPGHGLGAASVAGVKRHCRYEVPEGDRGPAVTSFVVPIRWELD